MLAPATPTRGYPRRNRGCSSESSSGLASMPASARCSAVIGVGALVSGIEPGPGLRKAMTSRRDFAPASNMQTLSQPKAIPPWGGGP